jgi:hypothetical protein
MWPFGTPRAVDRSAEMREHRDRTAPHLPTESAHARCLARAHQSGHVEVARSHQVGYLRAGRQRRITGWRQLPPLPMLQITVQPGESIDFADPVRGFPGFEHLPPAERVLDLWADDLLTVSHGTAWTYVVQARESFASQWLELLDRPTDAPFRHWYAVVCASFMGPTPVGEFRVADVDPTTYSTLVHIADRRDARAGSRGAGSLPHRVQPPLFA